MAKFLFPQPEEAVTTPRMDVFEGRFVGQPHAVAAFLVDV